MESTVTCADGIIESLTTCVRFLSVHQIARAWFGGDSLLADQIVSELSDSRLVSAESHLVHPELAVKEPLFRWSAESEGTPDFAPVAYRLRKRWTEQKEMTELVFPEQPACERYGGVRVRPRLSELSHDLHIGSIYLSVKNQFNSDSGLRWVSGDMLRSDRKTSQFGGNVPDAVIVNAAGGIQRIIEGGGSYRADKLRSLHEAYCDMAYEIW